MSWTREFPAGWAVPREIAEHPLLVDVSWGNDACPHFIFKAEQDLVEAEEVFGIHTIWVDYPDPEWRENPGVKRFRCYLPNSDDGLESEELEPVLAWITIIGAKLGAT